MEYNGTEIDRGTDKEGPFEGGEGKCSGKLLSQEVAVGLTRREDGRFPSPQTYTNTSTKPEKKKVTRSREKI